MAKVLSDPRYGVQYSTFDTSDNKSTKTLNYLNLSLNANETTPGYDVDEVFDFIGGTSSIIALTGATYDSAAIIAQMVIEEEG